MQRISSRDRFKWRADCASEKLMSLLFRRDASLSLLKMDEPFSWVDEQYA